MNPLAVPPREVVIRLYPGDTQVRMDELRRQIADELSEAAGPKRLNGKPGKAAADELDRLIESTRERVLTLRLRAAPHETFRRLQEAHPPRKGNDRDRLIGAHEGPFLTELLRASLIEPEVDAAAFDEAVAGWSETNWRIATNAAYELTAGEPLDLPKSSVASLLAGMRETAQRLRGDTE